MNNLLEWLAKFFGHIPVIGIEALSIKSLQATLALLVVYLGLRIWLRGIDRRYKKSDNTAIQTYKTVSRFVFWAVGRVIARHIAGLN